MTRQEPRGRAIGAGGAAAIADVADSAQLARLRGEAAVQRAVAEAAAVSAAFDVLERAVARAPRRVLLTFAERAGRAYARAMARLDAEDRRAVRELVRRSL